MFKAFYGLTFDPFTKEVESKNFYKSYQFKQGLSRLTRCANFYITNSCNIKMRKISLSRNLINFNQIQDV